ncbi:hypothetical protein WDU94_005896 [Cyamophila willieti]
MQPWIDEARSSTLSSNPVPMMEPSISKISIDIKCKKCKDFYGTPQQLGFCSVCYQNHLKQQKHRTELARERENTVEVVRQSPKQPGFSKFEDKIKQQGAKKLKNKLKDLLKPNTKGKNKRNVS